MMRDKIDNLVQLNRRIADLRRRIKEAKGRESQPWGGVDRIKILDLLNKTLKDLETRKAALASAGDPPALPGRQ